MKAPGRTTGGPDTYRKQITKNKRRRVHERDGWRCVECGKGPPEVALTLDHVVAVRAGGSNAIENLQTMCGPCNVAKDPGPFTRRRG